MSSFLGGVATLILIASLIAFIALQFNVSTDLTLMKVAAGGMAAAAFGASMLMLVEVPINGTFFVGVFCIGILGIVFVIGRWGSNKSVARLTKSTMRRHRADQTSD